MRIRCAHQFIEIVPKRLLFSVLRNQPRNFPNVTYFSVEGDPQFQYHGFFEDFGPPSLLQLYKFAAMMEDKLNSTNKAIHYYTSMNPMTKPNAVMYLTFFRMVHLNMDPDKAYEPMKGIANTLYPFRDASTLPSTFDLKVIDVLSGIYQAIQNDWFDFKTFDAVKWEKHEEPEQGDLNWIIPGKLLACASPYSFSPLPGGIKVATPNILLPIFKDLNIKHIVRLNKQYYDSFLFTDEGFKFTELYFPDGSIPPLDVVDKWLEIIEGDDSVAVHCKAGLGRTGTLIGCYLIKNYGFTAKEAIGWIRVCRPGSVIGPQQGFLQEFYNLLIKQNDCIETPIHPPMSSREITPPPRTSHLFFAPNKGVPLVKNEEEDELFPKPLRGSRRSMSVRAPRVSKPFFKSMKSNEWKFTIRSMKSINPLNHPQPRKVNQKTPMVSPR